MAICDSMRDAINRVSTTGGITRFNNPMLGYSLSRIVRWYKGRTKYEIHRIPDFASFEWQPRYYDHVIRDEKDAVRIREYIKYNPARWKEDDNYVDNT